MESSSAEQDEIIIKCSLEEIAKAFFKDYEIIWHDPRVHSEENKQYREQFEKICKVQTFTEWKEAEDYIKTAKTICHVITSGTNGELLVKEIFSSQNVPKIFTFCRNEDYHSTWTKDYVKILCTETKIEDVISQIQRNLAEWQRQTSSLKFDLPAFAPIFDDHDKSNMNYLHHYLKVIPNFRNRTQAKEDFITLSRGVYSDKKNEKYIAEFEQNYNDYKMEDTLRWYTQPSFLYKVINNCLRIATSDSIQWSRFLLKEIERAIKDQYRTKSKEFSGLLYRAAYLSEKEWSSLKSNMNREIEMHGFLSVSKDKNAALKFMGVDPSQKVFITIIVPKSPIEEEQGFAEVEEFSKFPKEKEVLFNVRSRFTIVETEDVYSQDLPYRHLVLFYGAQGLRNYIAEENPMQELTIEDIGDILCSRCQVPTAQMTEKIFFISLVNEEEPIIFCSKCLDDAYTPFLCVPYTGKTSTVNIKGLLINSNQPQIPLYGYECSQCGLKKQKAYFGCIDCSESRKRRWCKNCFEKKPDCFEAGHSVILETFPFSFWFDKISEKELNHMDFQNNLVAKSHHKFQQAEMYLETHEFENTIKYAKLYIEQNEAKIKDRSIAVSYNYIGLAYEKQGEYDRALEYYLKSLDVYKSVLGEIHPDIATSYNNIGLVYGTQGEYLKALESHFKSLDIYKSANLKIHPGIANTYLNMGALEKEHGEYNKALEYFQKSLLIKKLVYGENNPYVADCYNNIGLVYDEKAEKTKALEYHLKSLDIYKSFYGENHPHVATSYNNIGSVYEGRAEYAKALELFLKSLEISKSVHGENHPDTATSFHNIGFIYKQQGEYNKALEYLLKSLEIRKSVHGENHLAVAAPYHNIGLVYKRLGEYDQALIYLLKSLEIEKAAQKENHPDIAISYHNIGLVYNKRGEDDKALEYFLKSIEISKSVHGENHPAIATSYTYIGSIYDDKAEYNKALEFFLKSLEIKKSVHGENNPDTASSYNMIGFVYEEKTEYNEALEYYLKSLEIRKSVYGENHPEVALSYNNIGLVFQQQEKPDQALQYLFKSLEVRKSVHGENHPEVAILENNIAFIYDEQGESQKALEHYLKAWDIHQLVSGEEREWTEALRERVALLSKTEG